MKKVLCFGDSNTYGFNPKNGSRYNKQTRWTGILSDLLKNKFEIIEAGLNNRTCFSQNISGDEYTGIKTIQKFLTKNIDYILLFVGINDLQKFYNPSYAEFENGLTSMIKIIKNFNPDLKIILVIPNKLEKFVLNSYFAAYFDESSIEKSEKIKSIYEKVSQKFDLELINANKIVQASNIDGLHYEEKEHKLLAEYFADFLKNKA